MKKVFLMLLMISGSFVVASGINIKPLPTIDPGPVTPIYEYREKDFKFHPVDTEPEITVHCLFPGSTCRF